MAMVRYQQLVAKPHDGNYVSASGLAGEYTRVSECSVCVGKGSARHGSGRWTSGEAGLVPGTDALHMLSASGSAHRSRSA